MANWVSRLGDAYDNFKKWDNKNVFGPADTLGAIGGAYSAASNSIVGEAVGALAKPVGAGLNVLGYPLDLVKRGISTGGMVAQREDGDPGDIFSADMWHKAWNRSEDISAGQVLDTGLSEDISHIPGVIDDRPDFMKADDPYDEEHRKEREEYFHNSFAGKLNSGGIDLVLDFTTDPLAGVGSVVKGARIAKTTVANADKGAALAASVGKEVPEITKSAAKAGDRLKALYTRTDNLSAAEMAQMPEFKKSGDAGAIAYFMDHANKEFATDEAMRHGFKADIMGAVLGDSNAIERVKNYRADMADQIQRAGSPPKNMAYLSEYSRGDFGASMIAKANTDEAKAIETFKADRTRDQARLERVLRVSGSTNKIGSTLGERFAANANLDKIDQRFTSKLSEYVSPNGLFGSTVRHVIGQANMRVPGYVNIKDPTLGYKDVLNTLGQMKHTDTATRRQLANEFVSAADEQGRREVVQNIESTMFRDYGKKFGVTPEAVETFMQEARGRRAAYQQGLKDRLYSAAETDKIVQFYEPEDDVTHVFDKAFLTTHFEANHELTDPKVLHDVLSKGTNRRLLERAAKMNVGDKRALAIASKVSDFTDASAQSTAWLLNHGTRLWKDAALMRLAYPMRIQADTQARTMVHLGMMQYIMTRKQVVGGQVKYLLENSDGEKSLRNLFKEGDIDTALAKQFLPSEKDVAKGRNLHEGYDVFPAMGMEDVARIRAGMESTGGAAADIGNDIASADLRKLRGNGSWGKIKAGKPEWFENWKRAVDQIRTSPTARKSLELDDVDMLREWVNQQPEALAEWSSFQTTNMSQDEWLAKVINHSNQYLPTPEIKKLINNPDKAHELFDWRGAEERMESITGLKIARDEAHSTVIDIQRQIKDLQTRYEAMPKRSPERRALNIEIKDLREQKKTAKDERWQARAEYGDAKKPPTPGRLNPDSGLVEPMDVHGENYSPLQKGGFSEYADGVRNRWYKVAADIPETIMGRAPIYVDAYKQYMRDAIDRLGDEGVNSIGIDQIRKAADRRARQEVGEILFDSTQTSNAAHTMRLVAPFFSAWEDTMRKWGKLMYDNPTVPLNAHKAWDAPQDMGLVHDSEGSYHQDGKYYNVSGKEITKEEYAQRGEYIVLPKLWGRSSRGNENQGSSFKLNRNNLNLLFQGNPPWLPGLGPLVQIPTNEIARRSFPEHLNNPVMKYVLPFGVTDDSVPYQLMPSWVKQARDAMGGSKDYAQTYAMLFAQENSLYAAGERKSPPTPEEVEKRTRMWFITKAALANASPVSIQPTPKLQFYIDKAHEYRKNYGVKWQEKFYDDFPQYYDLSLSLSYNETGIQATDKAYAATQKFRKEIRDNPSLGWFFVGPDNLGGDFDANVNTWQRSTEAGGGKNFRSSKDPAAALKQVQAEKGWIEYDQVSRAVQLKLEERGLHSLQQVGAEDLADAMKVYKQSMAKENSAWFEEFSQRDQGKLISFVNTAQAAWKKDPKFAARSDQKKLAEYLEMRNALQAAMQTRSVKSLDHPENEQIKKAWDIYTTSLKQESPGFEQIWNRMLQADDLSQEL